MAARLFILVDCNNFFASCERVFRPDLRRVPIVVLSSNDGCIVARSNEAKSLGLKMGEPAFKSRDVLASGEVAIFSSNFELYSDISSRVMGTLETIAPGVLDVYSIDEAFIPLHGSMLPNADEMAREIVWRVAKWVGMPVSVGIGTTRTLAKLASETAKAELRAGRGDGVWRLDAESPETAELLKATPVEEVWGIGRRMAYRLQGIGVRTALDLRDADPPAIRKMLSVTGAATQMELRGVPCLDDGQTPGIRKSLVSSRSFGEKVGDRESLAQALAMHCDLAAARLRKERLEAGTIGIHVRTGHFSANAKCDLRAETPLPERTADTRILTRHALALLDATYKPGYAYAKAGVELSDIGLAGKRQPRLFEKGMDEEERRKGAMLMAAMDDVNRRYGRTTLKLGAQGPDNAEWRAKRQMRSPRYTTHADELPEVSIDFDPDKVNRKENPPRAPGPEVAIFAFAIVPKKENVLVVDRSLELRHGDVVVAEVGNAFVTKRLRLWDGKVFLEDKEGKKLEYDDESVVVGIVLRRMSMKVWGKTGPKGELAAKPVRFGVMADGL
ncbi:MAG: DUF4113 domain-containing protein [Desulfovibrio sp.]|jgi:DNA polymerase V|nr:DUF4113 domain-containing protein [Desulfovibrio sp.]